MAKMTVVEARMALEKAGAARGKAVVAYQKAWVALDIAKQEAKNEQQPSVQTLKHRKL